MLKKLYVKQIYTHRNMKENLVVLVNTRDIDFLNRAFADIAYIKNSSYLLFDLEKEDINKSLIRLNKIFNYTHEFQIDLKKGCLGIHFLSLEKNSFKNYPYDYSGKILNNKIEVINILEKNSIENNFLISSSPKVYKAIMNLLNLPTDQKLNLSLKHKIITSPLLGQNGWSSLTELFSVINSNTNSVVLRNHDDLNDAFVFKEGDDIDILCENFNFFCGIINARKREGGRCSFEVKVKEKYIPLDIRYVGDKYYDPLWAKDMLSRKLITNGIPHLSKEDYFFSLIYHSKLQKNAVKKVYIGRLDNLANSLGFSDLQDEFILNDDLCSKLLNGYLKQNNYNYTFTDDAGRNNLFLKNIDFIELNDLLSNWRVLLSASRKTLSRKIKEVLIRNLYKIKINASKAS
jgi:hypothetical protein